MKTFKNSMFMTKQILFNPISVLTSLKRHIKTDRFASLHLLVKVVDLDVLNSQHDFYKILKIFFQRNVKKILTRSTCRESSRTLFILFWKNKNVVLVPHFFSWLSSEGLGNFSKWFSKFWKSVCGTPHALLVILETAIIKLSS